MGIASDLLQGIPLNAVLRERVALLDDKFQVASAQAESLQFENKVLENKNASLQSKIEELERVNRQLKEEIDSLTHTDDLDETAIKVLTYTAQPGASTYSQAIAQGLGIPQPRVEYFLSKLCTLDYVTFSTNLRYGRMYQPTSKGLDYLFKKELI